jgi:long-subunit acyl-CoA synthetase (AMP-forming)
MKGYYKEPGMTAEAFDEENFFKTGDMGEFDR